MQNTPTLYWPPVLPQRPQRGEFTIAPGSSITTFEPDIGVPRTAKKSMSSPDYLEYPVLLRNKEQRDILFTFLKESDGLSWWLPEPHGLNKYILVKVQGSGKTAVEGFKNVGANRWVATLKLLVWPFAELPYVES